MNAAVFRARCAYVARRIGPIGWAGAVLLAVAAGVAVAGRAGMESANRSLAESVEAVRSDLARARQRDLALGDSSDPIGTVASQLPAAEGVPKFVEDVQLRAGRENLQVDRTEYQVQSALEGRALRYQLTMPAHGTYPGLRAWLAGLMHEYPNASLDEIALRRESDGGGQLEARVVLSFYSRSVP